MLTVTETGPGRLDVVVEGRIDAEAMRAGLDELIARSQGVEHGRMLFVVPEAVLPSLGALGVELSRLPKLLGLIRRYDRGAVLSDSSWLRRAAEAEGAILPGFAVRAFAMDRRAEAEDWLERAAAA
jgi:hypothetical protein